MTAWVAGRDPWTPMSANERGQLADTVRRARDEFDEITGYLVPGCVENLENRTLRAMLVGPERTYQALPEAVRERVNRDFLLPPGVWHQMFGLGLEIQGDSSAMREDGYILLLQLTYDDLMQWAFGDNGCYQFWISAAHLASHNWAGVRMTFECH